MLPIRSIAFFLASALLVVCMRASAQVPPHQPGTICFTPNFWCWAPQFGPPGAVCCVPIAVRLGPGEARLVRCTDRTPIAQRLPARFGTAAMWLKIMPDGIAAVRLLWGNDEGPHEASYHIGLATLADTCQRVRESLEEMVRTSRSEDLVLRARALKTLASQGAYLYYVLFDANAETGLHRRPLRAGWPNSIRSVTTSFGLPAIRRFMFHGRSCSKRTRTRSRVARTRRMPTPASGA